MNPIRPARALAASLLLALPVACVSTSSSVSDGKHNGPWLDPSPTLRVQIEDMARRLPWTHGIERVEMIQWFAGVGEPAYPKLLELVVDPRPDVAGAAYAALGATGDARLVEHVRAIPVPAGEGGVDLGYERSRALLRLGDWSSVPTLIAGLRDERPIPRSLCFQALTEATHERFDFDPRAEPEVREAAVVRWESWWASRKNDPLLPDAKPKPEAQKSEE